MRLVRSWPSHPPAGRNHVVDDAERLLNTDYDYAGLVELGDDIIQLDWDTAVSREDLIAFAKQCRAEPDRVRVAPCMIYTEDRPGLGRPVWNAKRYKDDGFTRFVTRDDETCHLFGFGMVYLPHELIAGFVHRTTAVRFGWKLTDVGFASWHYKYVRHEVPLAWDVHTVHLHYRISEVPL